MTTQTAHDPIGLVADNISTEPSSTAFSLDAANVPLEGGTDPTFGTVRWRTLINGNSDSPKEFVLGVAEFEPFGTLLPHRHDAAEFYFGLEGDGIVTIDGIEHEMRAGVALYVPADAEHDTVAGPNGLRISYGFAEASFADVHYRFSAANT